MGEKLIFMITSNQQDWPMVHRFCIKTQWQQHTNVVICSAHTWSSADLLTLFDDAHHPRNHQLIDHQSPTELSHFNWIQPVCRTDCNRAYGLGKKPGKMIFLSICKKRSNSLRLTIFDKKLFIGSISISLTTLVLSRIPTEHARFPSYLSCLVLDWPHWPIVDNHNFLGIVIVIIYRFGSTLQFLKKFCVETS